MCKRIIVDARGRGRCSAVAALIFSLAACAQGGASAVTHTPALRFAFVFGDDMVLQRDRVAPVWGTAATGDVITVRFGMSAVTAVTDSNGIWLARLPEMQASETPRVLVAQSRAMGTRVAVSNVLVGEVWLASGESNMECPLRLTQSGEREIGLAIDPQLRFFEVARQTNSGPVRDVLASWKICCPTNAADFAAVPYYFARYLRRDLRVPVGILRSTWGGTPLRAWAPQGALDAVPALDRTEKGKDEETLPKYVGPAAPGVLYRNMIEPLCPFAIRGVIWYQGESDSGSWAGYASAFGRLIGGWRAAWGYDFPFIFTQIAPFKGATPWLREEQVKVLRSVPGTAMVVTVDVGDGPKEHPRRKAPVGMRLDRAALALAYGRKLEYSGPLYESLSVEGERAVVRFTHVGEGLLSADGDLMGFEIAGEDRVFKAAKASIEGATVVVTSPEVRKPKAVRYGWHAMPKCNLMNRDGFPASPFRTDSWEAVGEKGNNATGQ